MTYADKLAAFGAQAQSYFRASVKDDSCYFSQECVPANGRGCDCCGTHRLKWLYPVLPDRDKSKVRWIGKDCWKNLETRGLLKDCYDAVETHHEPSL